MRGDKGDAWEKVRIIREPGPRHSLYAEETTISGGFLAPRVAHHLDLAQVALSEAPIPEVVEVRRWKK